jgi:hypothetical protein
MNTEGLSLGILRGSLYDEKTGTMVRTLQEPSKETDQGFSYPDKQGT